MAKKFTLNGEVGWEMDTRVVKGILYSAKGEDIIIDFSSPGGSVFEGIEIFNMFKNYSGKVTFNLVGLAASMGSYIPLAGDEITAEANAVFMIHNASIYTGGDHNQLRKSADIVERLSQMLAKEYTKKTGIDAESIAKLMDDETYLIGGAAILETGFVDSVNGEEDMDPDAKIIALAAAKESFNASMKKLRDEQPDDYEQVAALLPDLKCNAGSLLTDNITPAKAEESRDNQIKESKPMNKEELKAKHPEIYAAILAEGHTEGVNAERDRVNAHLILGNASGDTKTAFAAIEDGSAMTATLQAKYTAAGMNKRDIQDRAEDDKEATPADNVSAEEDTETDADAVAAAMEEKYGVAPEADRFREEEEFNSK